MKRVNRIVLSVMIMTGYTTAVLSQNLDSMSKIQRDSILIAKAKECVLRYGPEYYREYKTPVIREYITPLKGPENVTGENAGRKSHIVSFPYDTLTELLEYEYAADVAIWADTGVPVSISFGNGLGVFIEEVESKTKLEQEEMEEIIKTTMRVNYSRRPLRPIYDSDNPENKVPKNMDELKRRGYQEIEGRQWVRTKKDVPPNIDILKREGFEEIDGQWVRIKKQEALNRKK
jgi:hypothetical protein